jgi:uracil-DNA glycosylase family 4
VAVPDLVRARDSSALAASPDVSGPSAASRAPDTLAALAALSAEILDCRACPRLVAWREASAANPPARFRGETYHARAIPGFGDPSARILLLGLAPAKDGGNRTGRVFTGDRSGGFLFAALHRSGLANQPTSVSRDDGLQLRGAYVAAAVRCAPPDNKPLPDERDRCAPYLHRELMLLGELRVVVALGAFAWQAALQAFEATRAALPRPRPRFGHGAQTPAGPYTLLGAYHPSQQNTFTGRLTPGMLDTVLARAREIATTERP